MRPLKPSDSTPLLKHGHSNQTAHSHIQAAFEDFQGGRPQPLWAACARTQSLFPGFHHLFHYSITFPEAEIRLTSLSFPRSSLPLLKMISSSSLSTYGCITTWPMNIGMSSLLKYFLTWPSSISYIFLGPVIHLGHSLQSSESAFASRRHSVFHPFLFCVKRSPGSFSSRPMFSLSSFFYLTIYRYPRVYVCMFIFSVSVVPTLLFLICDA